jgi:hypothetical protein
MTIRMKIQANAKMSSKVNAKIIKVKDKGGDEMKDKKAVWSQ